MANEPTKAAPQQEQPKPEPKLYTIEWIILLLIAIVLDIADVINLVDFDTLPITDIIGLLVLDGWILLRGGPMARLIINQFIELIPGVGVIWVGYTVGIILSWYLDRHPKVNAVVQQAVQFIPGEGAVASKAAGRASQATQRVEAARQRVTARLNTLEEKYGKLVSVPRSALNNGRVERFLKQGADGALSGRGDGRRDSTLLSSPIGINTAPPQRVDLGGEGETLSDVYTAEGGLSSLAEQESALFNPPETNPQQAGQPTVYRTAPLKTRVSSDELAELIDTDTATSDETLDTEVGVDGIVSGQRTYAGPERHEELFDVSSLNRPSQISTPASLPVDEPFIVPDQPSPSAQPRVQPTIDQRRSAAYAQEHDVEIGPVFNLSESALRSGLIPPDTDDVSSRTTSPVTTSETSTPPTSSPETDQLPFFEPLTDTDEVEQVPLTTEAPPAPAPTHADEELTPPSTLPIAAVEKPFTTPETTVREVVVDRPSDQPVEQITPIVSVGLDERAKLLTPVARISYDFETSASRRAHILATAWKKSVPAQDLQALRAATIERVNERGTGYTPDEFRQIAGIPAHRFVEQAGTHPEELVEFILAPQGPSGRLRIVRLIMDQKAQQLAQRVAPELTTNDRSGATSVGEVALRSIYTAEHAAAERRARSS